MGRAHQLCPVALSSRSRRRGEGGRRSWNKWLELTLEEKRLSHHSCKTSTSMAPPVLPPATRK